jgi:hypothetical protein
MGAPHPRTAPEPAPIEGARWIPLTQDRWALIDDADYEAVSKTNWCFIKGRHDGVTGYAQSNILQDDGTRKRTFLHQHLLGHRQQVDHADGDGLNNRRSNLRVVTDVQNRMNSRTYKNNKSGFKGVHLHVGRWVATIKVNNKSTHLGRFDTAEEAARAYDQAALEHFGSYARINFPKEP